MLKFVKTITYFCLLKSFIDGVDLYRYLNVFKQCIN